MKHLRVCSLLFAICGASTALAQSFELRPGTGSTLVGNTFEVAPGTGSFQVEIWANLNAAIGGWSVALAFDTTTSSSGASAVRDGGPLAVTSVENAPAFASWTSTDGIIPPNQYRGAPNPAAGSNASFVSSRAFVSYSRPTQPIGAPPVNIVGSAHVLTATVSYSLANGDTFGDSLSEAGLFVFHVGGVGNPGNGASGTFGNASSPGLRFGSLKYQVKAVPEPSTLLALAAGLAAISSRRKRRPVR